MKRFSISDVGLSPFLDFRAGSRAEGLRPVLYPLGGKTKIIAANAPFNEGGIGKFLAAVVEDARTADTLEGYFAPAVKPNDARGHEISLHHFRWLFRVAFVRSSYSRRHLLTSKLFDRAVAARLTRAGVFHGFSGSALHSFSRARRLCFEQLVLESPTSHVDTVRRQHDIAHRSWPIEESWLHPRQCQRTLREYDEADLIYAPSEYARRSFLAAGMAPARIQRRFQPVAPRFTPPLVSMPGDGFHVVYVGRLEVAKGVPLLLQAFAGLSYPEASLTLVGGFASDAMDHYVRGHVRKDSRIRIQSGDPLPYLHRADVLVHASYEDGLGLAPLEALACGVPVIVTADTGMKEFVVPGQNGYIVPTGDVDALTRQMEVMAAKPLKGSFVPFGPDART